jgi:two-component system, NtrC family, response regulator PilR
LRDRDEDVTELTRVILEHLSQENGGSDVTLTDDALTALREYGFPGNVRELENILERALAMCDGNTVQPDDLMLPEHTPRPTVAAGDAEGTEQPASGKPPLPHNSDQPLDDYMSNLEREAIMKALEETRYNKTAAARKLGITFRALRYKLKKLDID